MRQIKTLDEAEAFCADFDRQPFHNNNMTLADCAEYTIAANNVRDVMYEWEIDGTFEYECDMREVALTMANLYIERVR